MDSLTELARSLPPSAWDLVVHVGAGGAPVSLAWPGVRRLVLVEGDAGTRLQLSMACAGRAGVEVWSDVVVPQAGVAAWHRYSLPMLNGPRAQEGLESIYPRLQHLGSAVAQGSAVADVLARALGDDGMADAGDPADRLLVLDVPGQEESLLGAIPAALLRRFEWIVVRGCRVPGAPGPTSRALLDTLADAGFRSREPDTDADPLWPLSLHRLHASTLLARQTVLMAEQLGRIEASSAEALAQARARHAEADARARGTIEALQAEAAQLARARDELQQQLLQAGAAADERLLETRQAHEHQAAAQAERLSLLERELAEACAAHDAQAQAATRLGEQLATVQAESEAQRAALDTTRRELIGSTDRHDALQAELATARRQHEEQLATLTAARDTALALADEQQAELLPLREQVALQQEQADQLQRELQQQQAALTAMTAERDEERRWHHDNAKWAHGLKAEGQRLGTELAGLREQLDEARRGAEAAAQEQARLQALVEAQQGQLADLATAAEAASQERQRLQQQLAAVAAERDQERAWHHDNATWAQTLKLEGERLAAELAGLGRQLDDARGLAETAGLEQARLQALADELHRQRAELTAAVETAAREQQLLQQQLASALAERDQERTWHHDNATWAKALKADNERLTQEHESLRRKTTDAEGRSRLLDQEILRAEAQLDLIKDVLLREKNF